MKLSTGLNSTEKLLVDHHEDAESNGSLGHLIIG